MSVVQRNSGTWTGTAFTASVPSALNGSSRLVVIVEGDVTVTTPSGFTLRGSAVTNMGQYWYERSTAGGATSQAFTTASGGGGWWMALEVYGTYNTSPAVVGGENGTSATTYASPSHTPPAGTADILVSFGSLNNTNDLTARTITGITGGFTLRGQGQSLISDWPLGAEGDQQAAGGVAYSSTATWSTAALTRGALIGSYTSLGAAPAVTTPHRRGGGKWSW